MFLRRWINHVRQLAAQPPREVTRPIPADSGDTATPPHPLDDSFSERAKAEGSVTSQDRSLYKAAVRLLEAGKYAEATEAFLHFAAVCPAMAADGHAGAARAATQQRGHAPDIMADSVRAPLSQAQRQQAIAHYRKAIEIDPEHIRSLIGLAYLLDATSPERIQLLEQARQLWQRYPRASPVPYHLLLDLGDCYRLTSQTEQARLTYEDATRRHPTRREAYQQLIELHSETGNDTQARHWRDAWAKCAKQWPRVRSRDRQTTYGKALPPNLWCVVANIVPERAYGPGGEMRLPGTKRFAPNAKVYLVQPTRGDRVLVLGRHRGSHRLIETIIQTGVLRNCRAKLVYEPRVIQRLLKYWDGSEQSRTRAEQWATRLQSRPDGS